MNYINPITRRRALTDESKRYYARLARDKARAEAYIAEQKAKQSTCAHRFVEWASPSGYVVERSCVHCGLERPR